MKIQRLKRGKTHFEIEMDGDTYEGLALVDRKLGVVTSLYLKEGNREISIIFDDYKVINNADFAMHRKIDIKDAKTQLNVDMRFTKLNLVETQEFPFSVSEKYKKID